MSDFKIPAVLKHLPPSKSPAFIAFCVFIAPLKACQGFQASVPDSDDCFPRFLHQMVKTFTISLTLSSMNS